jgi:hypothetical protein
MGSPDEMLSGHPHGVPLSIAIAEGCVTLHEISLMP